MKVTIVILLVIFAGYFVKEENYRRYFYLSNILICSIFLFFKPVLMFRGYDLARYYEQLTYFREIGFLDIFSGRIDDIGNSLFQSNLSLYPAYSIYMFLFSRISYNELLPFVTGILCWGLETSSLFTIIDKYEIKLNNTKRFAILAAFHMLHNLIEVAGIRNPLAMSLFIWAYVKDVYKDQRDMKVYGAYICSCLVHSMAYPLIALRLILLWSNKVSRRIIPITLVTITLVLIAYNFAPTTIYNILNSLKFPSFVTNAIQKGISYRKDIASYPRWKLLFYSFTYLTTYVMVKTVDSSKVADESTWDTKQFAKVVLIVIFLNLSITSLFGRIRMLLYPLLVLCLPIYMNYCQRKIIYAADTPIYNHRSNTKVVIISIMVFFTVMLVFIIDVFLSYIKMSSYLYF